MLDGKFELLPKSLGVELVELGFFTYRKLTPQNYYYWWYEVPDLSKLNEKAFTYHWQDVEKTEKFKWIEKLIDYHSDNESIYKLITPILNLESAKNLIDIETGKLDTDLIIEMYYGSKAKQPQQMELALNCA